MKYYIGIDGGGTKTKGVLCRENLEIISVSESGSSNLFSKGVENSAVVISELVNVLINNSGSALSEISGIGIGTAGGARKEQSEALKTELRKILKLNGIPDILVTSDARIALEAAFPDSPGIIIISGTGSVVFGKDGGGKIHRSGGYGKIIGDEGSAFSIGKKGLAVVSRELDSIHSGSLIKKMFEENFGAADTNRFINLIHSAEFDIASTANIVLDAAEKGDEFALKILDEETGLLADQAEAVHGKLGGSASGISFYGGLVTNNQIFSEYLRAKINERMPGIEIKKPDHPPEIGAVLLLKNIC